MAGNDVTDQYKEQKEEGEKEMAESNKNSLVKFIKDDDGYLAWIKQNPVGFVVNCDREPNSTYLILHHANCGTIMKATRGPGNWTIGNYIKVCSLDKIELKSWAKKEVDGELQPCQVCKP